MNKKIVSFGDSFILGSEMSNNEFGQQAWPGLAANQLGVDYETCAVVGCGNEAVARQIYTYFSKNSKKNTLAVVNWTWSMRWDFYMTHTDTWVTLGPTCAPEKLYHHLGHREAEYLIDFYRNYTGAGDTWNQYRSLQAIFAAQQFLKVNRIPVIQTYMDHSLFSKINTGDRVEHYNSYKDPSWPAVQTIHDLETLPVGIKQELDQDYNKSIVPEFIETLQDLTFPELLSLEGKTFLEWSRDRDYTVTPTPYDHPLEEAHQNAALLWKSHYQQMIDTITD
jgi:hypothetical protein